ncbi:MAG: phosphoribosylformylglycinamidine synthase subunit PurQ [Pseudobdellovibrionaceae bacterium]
MTKVGVLRFPGTNCDRDVFSWVEARGFEAEYLWHLDLFEEKKYDLLVVPGGFSYGDYLRSGALAALSPAMKSLRRFASAGGPVLGICNGFQILCESHLLPGALVKNEGRRFVDDWSELEVVNENSKFGAQFKKGQHLKLPIAHGDGRFYAPADELKKIYDQNQVWLRYVNNHNGSLGGIAGIMNEKKNVAALMPHPERAIYPWMGGQDGWGFL